MKSKRKRNSVEASKAITPDVTSLSRRRREKKRLWKSSFRVWATQVCRHLPHLKKLPRDRIYKRHDIKRQQPVCLTHPSTSPSCTPSTPSMATSNPACARADQRHQSPRAATSSARDASARPGWGRQRHGRCLVGMGLKNLHVSCWCYCLKQGQGLKRLWLGWCCLCSWSRVKAICWLLGWIRAFHELWSDAHERGRRLWRRRRGGSGRSCRSGRRLLRGRWWKRGCRGEGGLSLGVGR